MVQNAEGIINVCTRERFPSFPCFPGSHLTQFLFLLVDNVTHFSVWMESTSLYLQCYSFYRLSLFIFPALWLHTTFALNFPASTELSASECPGSPSPPTLPSLSTMLLSSLAPASPSVLGPSVQWAPRNPLPSSFQVFSPCNLIACLLIRILRRLLLLDI